MTELDNFPSEPPPPSAELDARSLEGEPPDEVFLEAYVASMPETYRVAFDEEAREAHAGVVHRRGGGATRIEIWKRLPERIVAVCVVADDRPGLLSRVSAALVANDMDVIAAQAYCRTRKDTLVEAVDLLWIRRMPSAGGVAFPVRSRDVARIEDSLDALLRGKATFGGAVRFARAVRATSASTRVRFERDARDGATLLLVEAVDRPGLLLVVSRTLFRERVQIVGSHVTTRGGHVLDRFQVTELDGAPLRPARRLAVQTAVLAALDESSRDEDA